MLALFLGAALAVLALAYVLLPILRGSAAAPLTALAPEAAPESSAIDALREIEFDQATGKLSDEDYAALKAAYTPRALDELRARESAAASAAPDGAAPEDAAEALIARMRQGGVACPHCGPRPESDALFCSDCGRMLGAGCPSCGAAVDSDAKFCVECGAGLSAEDSAPASPAPASSSP
ncbi:MAG: zinc ribbon domain-containing protein [Gemmatimonadaceae bacterium]|nr:zinc ribbon domain-containing protein [Gemmatimonadaceae bacterium]MCW5825990.1 zinc ribbon domain-containing protein [Gemmatimonadaceae bacterium]